MTRFQFIFAVAWIACLFAPAIVAQTSAPPKAPPAASNINNAATLEDDKATITAGERWLALIDAGKAGEAWDLASPMMKSSVARNKFVSGVRDMRKAYGKLASRTAVKFARAHSMPGGPDGDYALIEYELTFANGKKASEQLTWMLGLDEQWRVAGYYIR
jgi:hypothetical protein